VINCCRESGTTITLICRCSQPAPTGRLPRDDECHRPESGRSRAGLVRASGRGTGLRIGEALALETNHVSADFRTITVEQSCWAGTFQSPKTKNARWQVDLCGALAELLKTFVRDRQSGLVFANRAGKPLPQTNVVRRSLHPILKEHSERSRRASMLCGDFAPHGLGSSAHQKTSSDSGLDTPSSR
jgi:integrase